MSTGFRLLSLFAAVVLTACGGGGGGGGSGSVGSSGQATASSSQSSSISSSSSSSVTSSAGSSLLVGPQLALLAGRLGGPGSLDGTGAAARFDDPKGLAVDSAKNVYVADTLNCTIRKISPAGVVSTIAGKAGVCTHIDGSPAVARFEYPLSLAVAPDGSLYVGEANTIRKISTTGDVSTVAGASGFSGLINDVGTAARFASVTGIVVDSDGTLYIADGANGVIRKMAPNGVVTTLAGEGGQVGSTSNTLFCRPKSITFGVAHELIVSDGCLARIRKVSVSSGAVSTLIDLSAAGHGMMKEVVFGADGNYYVAEQSCIYKVTPAGSVTPFAGSWYACPGNAFDSSAQFYAIESMAVDADGNLYVGDSMTGHTNIKKITPAAKVTTLAGPEENSEYTVFGTGGAANFASPRAVIPGPPGSLYVLDGSNSAVNKVDANGLVTAVAGNPYTYGHQDGSGTAASFQDVYGMAKDASGNLYVTERLGHTVRKVDTSSVVSTYAGFAGTSGLVNGATSGSLFNMPVGIATDSSGNVFVADSGNYVIRRISASGVVSTFAGTGAQGTLDGAAASAQFFLLSAMTIDSANNLYVIDTHAIRKITPAGVVSTVAGVVGTSGHVDGLASSARFYDPRGLAVDSSGNLFVAERTFVRKITPGGNVTTVLGSTEAKGTTLGVLPLSLGSVSNVAIIAGGQLAITTEHAVVVTKDVSF
jgi:sugar lactone lactonase YvrE